MKQFSRIASHALTRYGVGDSLSGGPGLGCALGVVDGMFSNPARRLVQDGTI